MEKFPSPKQHVEETPLQEAITAKNVEYLLPVLGQKDRAKKDLIEKEYGVLKESLGNKLVELNPDLDRKSQYFTTEAASHFSLKRSLADVIYTFGASAEDLQPMGIQILELARTKGIPSVMMTSHHAKGGLGICAINEYLRNKGLVNGEVFSDGDNAAQQFRKKNETVMSSAGIFFVNKDIRLGDMDSQTVEEYEQQLALCKEMVVEDDAYHHPALWAHQVVYKSLAEKFIQKEHGNDAKKRVLFVEDRQRNFDGLVVAMTREINAGSLEVVNAKDYIEAAKLIEQGEWDGIITDCYFPYETGTGDKTHSEAIVQNIATQYIDTENFRALLAEQKQKQTELEDQIIAEFK